MCINQRRIFNRYTGHDMLVKCGKCPSCLQEKAFHRVQMIKDTACGYDCTLMVALTYDRFSCPYILKDEAYKFSHGELPFLNVYRDCSKRKVRDSDGSYNIKMRTRYKRVTLESVPFVKEVSFKGVRCVRHSDCKIGVPFYKDIQQFFARLRLNLKRHYNYENKFLVYCCSEYGAVSQRPHFHFALHCKKSDQEVLRSAIIESWPFSDLRKFPRAIEEAFRASSYLASYVNCSSKFPAFLKAYFKPKHSYSKGYGLDNPSYSLDNILSAFFSGSMSFKRKVNQCGLSKVVDVPIPARVINRYFPRFKGYNRFPPDEILSYMRGIFKFEMPVNGRILMPFELDNSVGFLNAKYNRHLNILKDDFYKISVRLINARNRFLRDCPDVHRGLGELDNYIKLHRDIWNLYSSTCLKLHLLNEDIPVVEKYDNFDVVFRDHISTDFDLSLVREVDPNKYISNIKRTSMMRDSYFNHIKHSRVANSIYLASDRHCEL